MIESSDFPFDEISMTGLNILNALANKRIARRVSGAMVAMALVHLSAATAQTQNADVASPAVQKEFGDFFAKFRVALKANDKAAIAGMTRLSIDDKSYPQKLAKNGACLQRGKAVYSRDGENNDTYSVSCGEVMFTFTRTASGFRFTDIGQND